jgi:hypothetical protein
MSSLLFIALPLLALYALFLIWYGGKGKPLTPVEIEGFMRQLQAQVQDQDMQTAMDEMQDLLNRDDGHEFVMQNLVRYRAKALYPPGYDLGDDPRAADQRYAKAILWPLLKNGNILVFVGRRSGTFIEPEGADAWHYVAMVRYRSRRDFARFALESSKANIFVHKWAAIEKTHVFPVKPLISLIMVRGTVAVMLLLIGTVLTLMTR